MTVEINVEDLKLALKENKFDEFFSNRIESFKKMCYVIESDIRYCKLFDDEVGRANLFPTYNGKWQKIRLSPQSESKFEVLEVINYVDYNCMMITEAGSIKSYRLLINGTQIHIKDYGTSYCENLYGRYSLTVNKFDSGNYVLTMGTSHMSLTKSVNFINASDKNIIFKLDGSIDKCHFRFSVIILSDGFEMKHDLKYHQLTSLNDYI